MLIIDKEFKSHIRPLTDTEKNLLAESIIKEGCRDPIVIWKNIIIDGHHRYEICSKLGLPYKVIENKDKQLVSREDVLDWIDKNQLGKRNLSKEDYDNRMGRLYNSEKKKHGGQGGHRWQQAKVIQVDGNQLPVEISTVVSEPESTATIFAKRFGVSEYTIKQNAIYAESIDKIAKNLGDDIRTKILYSEGHLSKIDVVFISEQSPEIQKQVFTNDDIISIKTNINRIKVEEEVEQIRQRNVSFLLEQKEKQERVVPIVDTRTLEELPCRYVPGMIDNSNLKKCPCGCGYLYDIDTDTWTKT